MPNYDDPNYRVAGLPAPVRGKITEFITAIERAAIVGSLHPDDMDEVRRHAARCKYNLERTIVTQISNARKS